MNPEKIKVNIFPNGYENEKCKYCRAKSKYCVMPKDSIKPVVQKSNEAIKYKIAKCMYLCEVHYLSWKQTIKE